MPYERATWEAIKEGRGAVVVIPLTNEPCLDVSSYEKTVNRPTIKHIW